MRSVPTNKQASPAVATSNPAIVNALRMADPKSPSSPAEFSRFEGLTRKLVNVPKSELDEKRKNESS
jgi:hypothetical protein